MQAFCRQNAELPQAGIWLPMGHCCPGCPLKGTRMKVDRAAYRLQRLYGPRGAVRQHSDSRLPIAVWPIPRIPAKQREV